MVKKRSQQSAMHTRKWLMAMAHCGNGTHTQHTFAKQNLRKKPEENETEHYPHTHTCNAFGHRQLSWCVTSFAGRFETSGSVSSGHRLYPSANKIATKISNQRNERTNDTQTQTQIRNSWTGITNERIFFLLAKCHSPHSVNFANSIHNISGKRVNFVYHKM